MAEMIIHGSRKKSRPRVYQAGRIAVFTGLMVLAMLFGQYQPASALPPDYPIQPFIQQNYDFSLPGLPLLQGQVPQPPVPYQGGTCIQGYIIDSYHQALEAVWPMVISKVDNGNSSQNNFNTEADGTFKLTGLGAGTYELQLTSEEGWRPILPVDNRLTVSLSGEGDKCVTVRFKLEAPSCIQVVKLDDGGQVDDDRVGLADWGFTATSEGAKLTTKTDWEGIGYFFDLKPGKWVVTEDNKTGWRPAKGYTNSVEIDLEPPHEPGTCDKLVFVNEQVSDACITVIKVDNVENPIEDWKIYLSRDDGTQPPDEGDTGEDGSVTFYDLALGDWTVTEEVQSWWSPVTPVKQQVSLEEPGVCQVVRFVNEPLGCVDGYKINSLEEPLKGWNISATNTDTGEKVTTTTDDEGYFQFKGLRLGEWLISEELQEGWTPVTPPELTVQVTKPFTCETVRFKNKTDYACLDVFKKDQIDGVGLPGWEISVAPAFGGESVSGETDGSGWVRFNGLTPGSYKVWEQVMPGWVPAGDTEKVVELEASGKCGVIKFYNRQEQMPPPPKQPKDHGGTRHCPMYYTVKPGDTLWSISMWSGVPVNALVRVNHLNKPSLIYSGTRLCIPLGDP